MYKFHQTRSKLSQDAQIKRSTPDCRMDSCWNGDSRTPMYLYRWDCMVCVCLCVFSHLVLSNFFDPTDCTPPSFSVHGILQARIRGWVAISYSRGSSWPTDQSHVFRVLCLACRFFTTEPPGTWGFHSHQSDAGLPWVSLYLSTLAVSLFIHIHIHIYLYDGFVSSTRL